MADDRNEDEDERPCLHCLIVETIDSFLAEFPAADDAQETAETEEVVSALAKVVAELTSGQNAAGRQEMIEQLMREVMNYDAEYREQDKLGAAGSAARH